MDKKGNKFTIMSFSNLRDDQKVIKIMAFGDIHKSHWKTQLGQGIYCLELTIVQETIHRPLDSSSLNRSCSSHHKS